MKKNIVILGSTGSIGCQALEVIEQQNTIFELHSITANNNADLLIQQALKYKPKNVVIINSDYYLKVNDALKNTQINVLSGDEALCEVVSDSVVDIVLTAMVGYSGLAPTLAAIKAHKNIALANKETLVVAGELIMQQAKANNCSIIPVDSEHSAIFQCLVGENSNTIETLYLTGSGGPFRNKDIDFIKTVTKKEALTHPNWKMGEKITIDSATLMNKGLEAIEAKWLFNVSPEQIQIVIHPQSIIHSLVQFHDGSIKAQMSLPNMRIPIQYALNYPKRTTSNIERFNFKEYPILNFEMPDKQKFPSLELAFESLKKMGNMPCILNAANEVAVHSFLSEKLNFYQIPIIVEKTMATATYIKNPCYNDYIESNLEASKIAKNFVNVLNVRKSV